MREFALAPEEHVVASLFPCQKTQHLVCVRRNVVLTTKRLLFESMNPMSPHECEIHQILDLRVKSGGTSAALKALVGLGLILIGTIGGYRIVTIGRFDLHHAPQFVMFFVNIGIVAAFVFSGLILIFNAGSNFGYRIHVRLPTHGGAFGKLSWIIPKTPNVLDETEVARFADQIRQRMRQKS